VNQPDSGAPSASRALGATPASLYRDGHRFESFQLHHSALLIFLLGTGTLPARLVHHVMPYVDQFCWAAMVSAPRAETPPPDPWPFLSVYGLGNPNENFLPPPP
jgi:hypothetical protein